MMQLDMPMFVYTCKMPTIQSVLNVTIARHAETDIDLIRPRILSGQMNRPLNSVGKIQANELAKRLARIEYSQIYVSDSQQVTETSNEIIVLQNKSEIIVDQRLRECYLGDITGMSYSDICTFLNRFSIPLDDYIDQYAETRKDFQDRIQDFYTEVILDSLLHQTNSDSTKPKNLLIISHGGWIDCLMRFLVDDLNFKLDTEENSRFPYRSSIYQFKIQKIISDDQNDYEWQGVIDIMNDASHLAGISRDGRGSVFKSGGKLTLYSPISIPFTSRKEIMGMLGVHSFFEPRFGEKSSPFKTSPTLHKPMIIDDDDSVTITIHRIKSLGW